jgi:hypothetical protein
MDTCWAVTGWASGRCAVCGFHTDSTGVEVALHMLDTAEESRETLCFPCSLWSEDNC